MSEPNAPNEPEKEGEKESLRPIIIIQRRIKKASHGAHGGSWKIAYADFVTAMMTFFMLMWLLSMLNKAQLEGISDYFKSANQQTTQQTQSAKVKTTTPPTQNTSTGTSTTTEGKTDSTVKTNDTKEMEKAIKKQNEKEEQKSMMAQIQLKNNIESQLKSNPELSQYKNALNIKVTAEGLKIELKDLQGKPMFTDGKTDFANYAKTLLGWLAPTLNKYPNQVMIVGHTDSLPMNGKNYSNWELSGDRAAATRRALVDAGMDDRKIIRIVGAADTTDVPNAKGTDPSNRRIVIMVLTDKATKDLQDQ